jgi:hypothetical protein
MSLIITFMFEPAKLQMNCASASGMSTARADTPPVDRVTLHLPRAGIMACRGASLTDDELSTQGAGGR